MEPVATHNTTPAQFHRYYDYFEAINLSMLPNMAIYACEHGM
jgi:hypothetical protein